MDSEKKIKIVRIIARLNIGGPAIHTILLTAGLNAGGFESILVCGSIGKGESDMHYYARQKGVSPIQIPQLQRDLNFFRDLVAFTKIFFLLIREKPQVIHTHTAKAGALGRTAAFFYKLFFNKNARIIHTFHGHVFEGYFSRFNSLFFILVEKALALFTDVLVTVSDSVKDDIVSLGIAGRNKIRVVPIGLELDKFLSVNHKQRDFIQIGIIGRLVPIKNHGLFIEAAHRLMNTSGTRKIKFVVVGDGELSGALRQRVSFLGMSRYFEFQGWRRDLDKVYADLDIVALTSLNEGTPVSLIEALACARPIVATDVGGVKDILGRMQSQAQGGCGTFAVHEYGLSVKSQDASGLAGALAFLLDNSAVRAKIGESGRAWVSEQFSIARLLENLRGLYSAVYK